VNGVVRRLYLLRWRASALLCLPGLLLIAWYSFGAFARFDAARRADDDEIRLDVELFHIELHDLLRRDAARVRIRPPPAVPLIPRFSIEVRRPDLKTLLDSRKQSDRPYVPVTLIDGKQRLSAEARLLGERPWHVLYKQASLKIQLPKGDLVDGSRVLTRLERAAANAWHSLMPGVCCCFAAAPCCPPRAQKAIFGTPPTIWRNISEQP
jgi:hypothetical protein